MSNILSGRPIGRKIRGVAAKEIEDNPPFLSPLITKGMNTGGDPVDLDPAEGVLVRNAAFTGNKFSRRLGHSMFTPTRPTVNRVQNLFSIKLYDGTLVILRMDEDKIYRWTPAAWIEITGAGLAGASTDHFNLASILNNVYTTNNGANKVIKLNLTANTYAEVASSVKFKYLFSQYNRIVGLYDNTGTGDPIYVGWSGDLNTDQYDSTVDPSAGYTRLAESQTGVPDFITGGFGFGDTALILRERSLWESIKQPSATNPFYFAAKLPEYGCDIPYSAQQIPGGIIWADRRWNTVLAYKIGAAEPIAIGRRIENDLVLNTVDPTSIFSGYDQFNMVYTLGITIPGSNDAVMWKYNQKEDSWEYDEIQYASCISTVAYAASGFTIDSLSGTIDSLTGTIDGLSPSVTSMVNLLGMNNGKIIKEDASVFTDVYGDGVIGDLGGDIGGLVGVIGDLDITSGSIFTTEFISKTYMTPERDLYVRRFVMIVEPVSTSDIVIAYSTDNGVTYTTYKTVTVSGADRGKRKSIVCNKHIKAHQFNWKITSTSGQFYVTYYEITNDKGPYSRRA